MRNTYKIHPVKKSNAHTSNRVPVNSSVVNKILRTGIQPKLKIGAVNDPAEIEADRVADQVMRMPAPVVSDNPAPPSDLSSDGNNQPSSTAPILRRKCTACDDEDKVQRKEAKLEPTTQAHKPPIIRMKASGGNSGGSAASPEASAAINSLGAGTPLPASERSFFEPRFGQDLSNIRLHTGSTADAASKAINARAFSLGDSIAFADGEYQPGTHSGQTLMAHEITHALQGGQIIQRLVDECWIVYGDGNYKYRLNADQSIDILEGPTRKVSLKKGNNGYASIKNEIDNSVKIPCDQESSLPQSNSLPVTSVPVSDTNSTTSLYTTLNNTIESKNFVSDTNLPILDTNLLNFENTNFNVSYSTNTEDHLENSNTNFNVPDTVANILDTSGVPSKSSMNIATPESTNQEIAEPAETTSAISENELHISHGIFQLALEGRFEGKYDVKKPHFPEYVYIFKSAPKNTNSDNLYKKDENYRFKKSTEGKWVRSRDPGPKIRNCNI